MDTADPPEACARGDVLALVAGAGLPLAFAPAGAWPLAVLCPALLFALWARVRPAVAARRGLLFGAGMFGVGVSWVYVAIHDFGFTGSREIPTPWIDSIAARGVVFSAVYVTASVCSPSRAGLITCRRTIVASENSPACAMWAA